MTPVSQCYTSLGKAMFIMGKMSHQELKSTVSGRTEDTPALLYSRVCSIEPKQTPEKN